jgi:hypothetical protein
VTHRNIHRPIERTGNRLSFLIRQHDPYSEEGLPPAPLRDATTTMTMTDELVAGGGGLMASSHDDALKWLQRVQQISAPLVGTVRGHCGRWLAS